MIHEGKSETSTGPHGRQELSDLYDDEGAK